MNTCPDCGLDGLAEDEFCPVCHFDPCAEENNPDDPDLHIVEWHFEYDYPEYNKAHYADA